MEILKVVFIHKCLQMKNLLHIIFIIKIVQIKVMLQVTLIIKSLWIFFYCHIFCSFYLYLPKLECIGGGPKQGHCSLFWNIFVVAYCHSRDAFKSGHFTYKIISEITHINACEKCQWTGLPMLTYKAPLFMDMGQLSFQRRLVIEP